MAAIHALPHPECHWLETHDGLVDWILILAGALIAFLASTSLAE